MLKLYVRDPITAEVCGTNVTITCVKITYLWHISNPVIYVRCVYSSSVETAKKLARIDRITAIFSNVREHVRKGNTYVMVVYASPHLSGGGVVPTHAKLATFRTMRLPVTLELLELLATFNIPQANRLVTRRWVTRPTDELRWIRWVELDAKDIRAAIFSNVRFLVNFSTPLPR